MAEDDIYGNKTKYEKFLANLEQLKTIPENNSKIGRESTIVKII